MAVLGIFEPVAEGTNEPLIQKPLLTLFYSCCTIFLTIWLNLTLLPELGLFDKEFFKTYC